jgi:hypothetical protein
MISAIAGEMSAQRTEGAGGRRPRLEAPSVASGDISPAAARRGRAGERVRIARQPARGPTIQLVPNIAHAALPRDRGRDVREADRGGRRATKSPRRPLCRLRRHLPRRCASRESRRARSDRAATSARANDPARAEHRAHGSPPRSRGRCPRSGQRGQASDEITPTPPLSPPATSPPPLRVEGEQESAFGSRCNQRAGQRSSSCRTSRTLLSPAIAGEMSAQRTEGAGVRGSPPPFASATPSRSPSECQVHNSEANRARTGSR